MSDATLGPRLATRGEDWLRRYYSLRAVFSIAWVVAALTLARGMPVAAALLLVVYPAWDALANIVDARRNGGLAQNATQAFNIGVSGAAAVAVAIALGRSMHAVLAVFGVWAILAGFFQLATGVRRWKAHGAQWAMILSGAQSMLAGLFFIRQANGDRAGSIVDIAPYAAFGAFYFLCSAIGLTVSDRQGRKKRAAR